MEKRIWKGGINVSHKKEPPKVLPLVEKRLLKVDKAIGESVVKKVVDTT
jgi:hypothetical protein